MKQFSHFSHRHPLHLQESEDKHQQEEIICSGCELDIQSNLAYTCTKPTCNFILHKSCLELPRQIRHKSHPKHSLSLVPSPPYNDGEFTCDACGDSGHAFTFHCSTCKFDLHVECASLPETEEIEEHEHALTLFYCFPFEEEKDNFCCEVCHFPLAKSCWIYCCLACNYGTHLECIADYQECKN